MVIRYNSNGSLDPSFGNGGIVITDLGGDYDTAYGMAIQPDDGKIVVVGLTGPELDTDFAVVRYNSNGSLDTSFDSDGRVITNVGGYYDTANTVAVQPSSGEILVAGTTGGQFALTRYNSNGSLDTSFDADGIVTTTINNYGVILDMALQPDGRIVAVGYSLDENFFPDFALARYNGNGSLDTSFDTDGIVTTSIGERDNMASAIKLQSDGKIIVAGVANTVVRKDFALARYNSNGSLDPTFDGDGIVVSALGSGYSGAAALALQGDGRIVAAGNANSTFAVARYQTNGSLDPTFDADGKVFTNLGNGSDRAAEMALQPDGKIIVVGSRWSGNFTDVAVVRYNRDGGLDPTFGNEGITITPVNNSSDNAYAVAVQPDGKIVVVGTTLLEDESFSRSMFLVVRYNSNGTLDTTFGTGGIVTTSIGTNFFNTASAVGIQNDGKIVVAGYSNNDFAMARYNDNGSLDTTFSGDGMVVTPISLDNSNQAYDLAIQSDGKIIAVGSNGTDFAIVRYNANGSLDTSFGGDGIVTNPVNGTAYSVALQADNRIVVAGFSYDVDGYYTRFTVARYSDDGSLDTTFDGDGLAITPISNNSDVAYGVTVQSDGQIIVVGNSNTEVETDFTVIRYNSDGSLDTSFDIDGIVITPFGSITRNEALAVALQSNRKVVVAGVSNNDIAVVRYQGDFSSPDLTLTKTVNNTAPAPGERITYTISIQNNGNKAATNAVISDTLPSGLTLAGPITLNPSGVGIVGTPPTLVSSLTITAGQRITVTVPVTVGNTLVGDSQITNTAAVSSAEVITLITDAVTITTAANNEDFDQTYLPVIIKAPQN